MCDATDSELSIRHLADAITSGGPAAEHAACLLYLTPTYPHQAAPTTPLPPPRRRRQRHDSSCESFVLAGTEETEEEEMAVPEEQPEHTDAADNADCAPIGEGSSSTNSADADDDPPHMHIIYHNNNNNNGDNQSLSGQACLHRCAGRPPASPRSSPASQCTAVTVTEGDDGLVRVTFRKQQPKKYHSAVNRIRNESVMRSRSFQEQGVKPLLRNSRFFVSRHQQTAAVNQLDTISSDLHLDTRSQTIEITVLDEHGVRISDTGATTGAAGSERGGGQADVASVSEGGAYDSGSQENLKSAPGGSMGGNSLQLLLRLFRRVRQLTMGLRRPKGAGAKATLRRGDCAMV